VKLPLGNQQGGNNDRDKNKDLLVLVDERHMKINNSMATLTGRVDDIEKYLEKIESMGNFEGFCG